MWQNIKRPVASILLSYPFLVLLVSILFIAPSSASYLQVVNGTTIQYSNTTELVDMNNTYHNVSIIAINQNLSGYKQINVTAYSDHSGTNFRVLKNDVAIQTTTIGVSSYTVYSYYFNDNWSNGDVFTLQMKAYSGSYNVGAKNFNISFDYVSAPTITNPANNSIFFNPFQINWTSSSLSIITWKTSVIDDSAITNTLYESISPLNNSSSPYLDIPSFPFWGKYYVSVTADDLYDSSNVSVFLGGIQYNQSTPNNFTENNYANINATIYADNLTTVNYSFDGAITELYSPNLILYYSFDNNSAIGDSSVYARDTSISNRYSSWNGSYAPWNTSGIRGGSAYFNGNQSQYLHTNLTRTNASIDQEYTVIAIVKPRNVSSAWRGIMGDWTGQGRSMHLSIASNNTFANAVNTNGTQKTVYSNFNATNDTWYFIASTFRMNDSLKMYSGCDLVGTVAAPGTYWTDNGSANYNDYDVGNRGKGWGDYIDVVDTVYWDGNIDEVLLFNKTMTQSEICALNNMSLKRTDSTHFEYSNNITGLIEGEAHNYSIELNEYNTGLHNITQYTGGWKNNDEVEITNSLNEPLYNYPVKVDFFDTNTNYSQIASDGRDLRFELQDGTNLPYYIEKWKGYQFIEFRDLPYPTNSYNNQTYMNGQYVYDINNDGLPEYILAPYYSTGGVQYGSDNGSLIAYSYDGQRMWTFTAPDNASLMGVWCGNLYNTGYNQCITGSAKHYNESLEVDGQHHLYIINASSGLELFNITTDKLSVDDHLRSMWAGNVTGDSQKEIVFGRKEDDRVSIYNSSTGTRLCNITLGTIFVQKVNIDDVDGDGNNEIIVAGDDSGTYPNLNGKVWVADGSCNIKYSNNNFNISDEITLGQTGYDLFSELLGNEIISPSFRGFGYNENHSKLTLLSANTTTSNLDILWQKRIASGLSGVNIAPIINGSSDVFIWQGWLLKTDLSANETYNSTYDTGELMLLDRNGTVLTTYPTTPRGVTAYNLDSDPSDIEVMVSNDNNSIKFYKVLRNVSTVWVNVPSISANSSLNIVRKYNNSYAASESIRSAKYLVDDTFQNYSSNLTVRRGTGFKIKNSILTTPDEADTSNRSMISYLVNLSNIQYTIDTKRIGEGTRSGAEYYISLSDRVSNFTTDGYYFGYTYLGGLKNASHYYGRYNNSGAVAKYYIENYSWPAYNGYSQGLFNFINEDKLGVRISVYNNSHKVDYAYNDAGYVRLFDTIDANESNITTAGDIAFGNRLGQVEFDNLTVRNYVFPEPITQLQSDTTPPDSITNIWYESGEDYILAHWINPLNGDFAYITLKYANGTIYKNTTSNDINTENFTGLYGINISSQTVDNNGNINQILIWLNYSIPINVTSIYPENITSSIQGISKEFNITLNQEADIQWQVDNITQEWDNGTLIGNYTNSTASIGTHMVNATGCNDQGCATQLWEWTVLEILYPNPVINLASTKNQTMINWTWEADQP